MANGSRFNHRDRTAGSRYRREKTIEETRPSSRRLVLEKAVWLNSRESGSVTIRRTTRKTVCPETGFLRSLGGCHPTCGSPLTLQSPSALLPPSSSPPPRDHFDSKLWCVPSPCGREWHDGSIIARVLLGITLCGEIRCQACRRNCRDVNWMHM